jgi:hypothetical protein
MTKTEAERSAIAAWRRLPLKDRQTEEQAALFAMSIHANYDFPCAGDRYQTIKAWLLHDMGITRGVL